MSRIRWVVYIVIAALVLGVIFTPGWRKIYRLNQRSVALDDEIRRLQVRNQYSENEAMALHNDPVYLEKVAREKFGKVKKGEIVYKIVE